MTRSSGFRSLTAAPLREETPKSMRILAWCLLGLAAVSLFLAGYVYLGDKNARKVDRIQSFAGLRAIHANWVDQGRPLQFDPKAYASSQRIQFVRETNTYSVGAQTVKVLASARAPSFPDKEHLVISEEGQMFWIDGMGNAKPAVTK